MLTLETGREAIAATCAKKVMEIREFPDLNQLPSRIAFCDVIV